MKSLRLISIMFHLFFATHAYGQMKVQILPTHPTDCRQSYTERAVELYHAAVVENGNLIQIYAQFWSISCINGQKTFLSFPEQDERRLAVLMKDGWRYPWDYKAPARLEAHNIDDQYRPYVSIVMEFDKDQLFAKRQRREFELVLNPERGSSAVWTVRLSKGSQPQEATRVFFKN
jgi:hypothetical protein